MRYIPNFGGSFARLRSVLQSKTIHLPVSAINAAHATTFSVPFKGNEIFFGSSGGSQDHIVPAIGLIGELSPEKVSCSGELIIGDNPHDTIVCKELYDSTSLGFGSAEMAKL
jgi:hypothetical protein